MRRQQQRAASHFDRQASAYAALRRDGLVGRLVAREEDLCLKALAVAAGDSVLDAGCGSGHYSALIDAAGGIPFGVDQSPRMMEVYRERGFEGCLANIENLALNRRFDRVLCAGALEFLVDVPQGIARLVDHLEEGGRLVLVIPRFGPGGWLYWLYHRSHGVRVHLWTRAGARRLLLGKGLQVIAQVRANALTDVLTSRKHAPPERLSSQTAG